jgi:uncharacterized protein YdeI (BOF family)
MQQVDEVNNNLHSGPNLEEEGVEQAKSKDDELSTLSGSITKTVNEVKL